MTAVREKALKRLKSPPTTVVVERDRDPHLDTVADGTEVLIDSGNGDAIREALARVAPGGSVFVGPGTYTLGVAPLVLYDHIHLTGTSPLASAAQNGRRR